MNAGNHEGGLASLPRRPQYHYFYGSTDTDYGSHSHAETPSGAQEQESLIGESLVPTDNEEEPPNNSDFDHEHVLISSGNGMRHVVGGDNRTSAQKSYQNGNGHHSSGPFRSLENSLQSLREKHPIVHIVSLVGCMTVCMVVFAVTLFPSTRHTAAGALGVATEGAKKFVLKFPVVDRSKSDPLSAFINKDLFHQNLLYKGNDPFREFAFAFPTGAFWTNLVLPPTADRGYSYPIAVYPYAYKWSGNSMAVSYPSAHRKEEAKAVHDYFFPDLTFSTTEDVRERKIIDFDPLSVNLNFRTTNRGSWTTYLVQGSPYITMEYDNVTPIIKALSTFKSVLCPGEEGKEDSFDDNFPDDEGSRRRLFGVCRSSGEGDNNVIRGVQFVLQSQEGMNWIVFSSEPISFVFDTRRKTEVYSAKAFKGTIRLAVIPPSSKLRDTNNDMVQISSSTGLRRLVYHAGVYPVGGKVDYDFRDPTSDTTTTAGATKNVITARTGSGTIASVMKPSKLTGSRIATVHFQFTTKAINSNTNTASSAASTSTGLLMLALPHHVVYLTNGHLLDNKHFDLVYKCIKGNMTPVVGSSWSYDEPLLSLGFEHNIAGVQQIFSDPTIRRLMLENLENDLKIAPPTRDENIYGFGKQVARLAQLAHIADELDVGSSGTASRNNKSSNSTQRTRRAATLDDRMANIRRVATDKLSNYLKLLLDNQLSDSLFFDAALGGLVSTDGISDWNADFGNGRYNDHHFHYGYLLYACAVMGKLNSTFVDQYGDKVDNIMHDVAHNSKINDGSFFPLSRHMSWFDGHSFASGLFPFGNGKSQESSSEAVNCYYGAYLWSLARNGAHGKPSSDLSPATDFSRLLLAMEVRGAKTYWHMTPPSASGVSNATISANPTVYSPQFAKNYMVGNMGMLDAICSTWFGTENLYVHMINFLPVTSITKELFERDYVKNEYADIISQYPNAEMAWRGYVVCDHALVAPMAAWKNALELRSEQLDAGLSKSQVLFFTMTSPAGFNISQLSNAGSNGGISTDTKPARSGGHSGDSNEVSSCIDHKACIDAGLEGLCCPTSEGVFLGCCNDSGR